MSFVIYSCETGKCWNQNIFTNLQNFVKIWKNSENTPNIAKINRVFSGKGRGDRALILTYLDNPVAVAFPHYWISFSISVIFRGKRVVKVGPKVQTLGRFLFHENSNPSYFFQTMFLFVRVLLMRILAILDHIWGSKGPKISQKRPFHGYWIGTQNIENNLTTTNAILMKLTTIMYLHESVNRKPLRARNSIFWRNSYEFLDYINRHICHVLTCVASLLKFLYKFYEKPLKIGPKWLLC